MLLMYFYYFQFGTDVNQISYRYHWIIFLNTKLIKRIQTRIEFWFSKIHLQLRSHHSGNFIAHYIRAKLLSNNRSSCCCFLPSAQSIVGSPLFSSSLNDTLQSRNPSLLRPLHHSSKLQDSRSLIKDPISTVFFLFLSIVKFLVFCL